MRLTVHGCRVLSPARGDSKYLVEHWSDEAEDCMLVASAAEVGNLSSTWLQGYMIVRLQLPWQFVAYIELTFDISIASRLPSL